MDNDRLQQGGHGRRCRLLDECVHALGDIGDHDAARTVGFLCGNDLAVLYHMEDRVREGSFRIVQLQQFDFDAGVIFKN